MESKYYKMMFAFEETHWWFAGKRSIIFSILDKFYKGRKDLKILDAGCGTGIMLTHLKKYGGVTGVDDSALALSLCRKRGHRQLFEAPIARLPFKEGTFDIITCLDVLCLQQGRNDQEVIKELFRASKKGGRVIISDPAYRFLWSGHDEAFQVKYRYTKRVFIKKMKAAGFSIERVTYWNTFLFLPIFTIRMLKNLCRSDPSSDVKVAPLPFNKILTSILKLEACLLHRINLPFGVSVLCVGMKPL